ncbi:MAG: YbeD family protein [Bradymonadaceae bacterium]
MTDRNALKEKLNAVHVFPCTYVYKVIGENSAEFIARVVQAAVHVVGDAGDLSVATRESSGGKHLAVTLTVGVVDAETVLDIYEMLRIVDGVRFML